MKKFNKNSTIGEVLDVDESNSVILQGFGMHCVYCPMSQMESLEEAGTVHDADIDLMVKKLNEDAQQEKK